MKGIIPESAVFTWPRGRVDVRSWDAAIDTVQQSLLGMAVANDVNDEQDFVLTEVFKECERLRAKEYLETVRTNHELAKKYAIRPRKDKRGVDLISDALPFESAVVWRCRCRCERNRLRQAFQSLT